MSLHQLWEAATLADGEIRVWRLGKGILWLRREDEHLLVAHTSGNEPVDGQIGPASLPPPDGLSWVRWMCGQDAEHVRVQPVMPDRPVMLLPKEDNRLPSGGSGRIFVPVPAWLRLHVGRKERERVLEEIPTETLSNTWFGDPHEGELCYSLNQDKLHFTPDSLPPTSADIICLVTIENSTTEALKFQKLCLRVAHLRVYQGTSRLWSNQVVVVFEGNEHGSRLSYGKQPPTYEQPVTLLTPEAQRPELSLRARSLGSLKSLVSTNHWGE